MKLKCLNSVLILSLLLAISPMKVHAEDAKSDANLNPTSILVIQKVEVPINEPAADEIIKKAIIEETVKSKLYDIEAIDIEKSSIVLSAIDLSKVKEHKVNALINLELKPSASLQFVDKTFQSEVLINVVDNEAPVIDMKYNYYNLEYNEEYKPLDYIESIFDNSFEQEFDISVEGAENISSENPGVHYVTYHVKDSSGNEATLDFKMIVDGKPKTKTKKSKNVAINYSGDYSVQEMLDAINAVRSEYGLYALTLGSDSAQAASAVRASEAAGYVSHTRPDGTSYKTAFNDYGVSYSYAVEILTYAGSTVQDKLNWWMNSPTHRKHVLTSTARKISIGYSGKMWQAIVYND